jgi:AcrR family transcriptional regulator
MAYSDDQRDEIRGSIAQECFAQIRAGGLSSVSARTLARAMGKSTGWLYNFHPDFDTVVLTANSMTLALLDGRLTAAAESHAGQSVAARFLALALAYMQFSQDETRLWAALFEHRMTEGRTLSDEHKKEHYILFRHIEAPLSEVLPDMPPEELTATARTIYSAVHGIVSLGLQPRLDPVPVPMLKHQLALITRAFAEGYRPAAD